MLFEAIFDKLQPVAEEESKILCFWRNPGPNDEARREVLDAVRFLVYEKFPFTPKATIFEIRAVDKLRTSFWEKILSVFDQNPDILDPYILITKAEVKPDEEKETTS